MSKHIFMCNHFPFNRWIYGLFKWLDPFAWKEKWGMSDFVLSYDSIKAPLNSLCQTAHYIIYITVFLLKACLYYFALFLLFWYTI